MEEKSAIENFDKFEKEFKILFDKYYNLKDYKVIVHITEYNDKEKYCSSTIGNGCLVCFAAEIAELFEKGEICHTKDVN